MKRKLSGEMKLFTAMICLMILFLWVGPLIKPIFISLWIKIPFTVITAFATYIFIAIDREYNDDCMTDEETYTDDDDSISWGDVWP